MKLSQFRFDLPLNLIAQNPTKRREDSRMMVIHRKTGVIEDKHFRDIIDYFNAYSGNRTFSIYNRANNSKIASKSENLSPDKLYSIFVADTASKTTFITATDDLVRPATGKAKLRFVHLSPDADKLDVTSGDSTLFSGKAYKEHTSFKVIEGDKTYSFKIKKNQTSIIKVALDNIVIKKNRIYTILIKGFSGKNDAYKIDAEIITNLE